MRLPQQPSRLGVLLVIPLWSLSSGCDNPSESPPPLRIDAIDVTAGYDSAKLTIEGPDVERSILIHVFVDTTPDVSRTIYDVHWRFRRYETLLVSGLSTASRYHIVALLEDSSGHLGEPSPVVSFPMGIENVPELGSPLDVTPSWESPESVCLAWTAATFHDPEDLFVEVRHEIQRRVTGTTGWVVIDRQVESPTPVRGLHPGETYELRVVAYIDAYDQRSSESTLLPLTTPTSGRPSPPSGLGLVSCPRKNYT